MTTYRKKPTLVDAWQLPESATKEQFDALLAEIAGVYGEEINEADRLVSIEWDEDRQRAFLQTPTVESEWEPGEWLIREHENRWFVMLDEDLKADYDLEPTARPGFIQSI